MVKVSSSDIIAILRRFDYANDENVPRQVENITYNHPTATSTLVSFRFNKQKGHILYDDTAEDDADWVTGQMVAATPGSSVDIAINPHSAVHTYGLPYKGKDVYLGWETSSLKRLDVFLAAEHPEVSRSLWQKYIKAGYVSVDGDVQTSIKYDISPDDTVTYSIPEQAKTDDQMLPVIYEDENVIVIDKPAGVLTHSKGALSDEFTAADFIKRSSSYNTDTNRPGIVHRLDRDTSGILIGVKNDETATYLQKQFANRTVKKMYTAVLAGHPKNEKAIIDIPIGRNPSTPSTFRADPKGKSATTEYAVIKKTGTLSLVELRPKTGRTHQLRVHMAHLGTPILGDRIYGVEADRLYLHATTLELTLPGGIRKIFSSPVPSEFLAPFDA